MSTFTDGPVAGTSLVLRRSPYLLRVVVDRATGKADALDMLEDEPSEGEVVHVYRLMAPPQEAHICGRGRGQSGWFSFGLYEYVSDGPDDATARNTDAWRAWACRKHLGET